VVVRNNVNGVLVGPIFDTRRLLERVACYKCKKHHAACKRPMMMVGKGPV
jgi:hypothetical protein